MAKKLKSNDIINLAKKEFPYKKIIVTSMGGQEFEVLIQEKLNETSIMELIIDLTERSNYCTKNNIEFNILLNTYFLLIKYFTDIEFSKYKSVKKQYEQELLTVNKLIDMEIFEQILNHFNPETMDKIQKSLEKYAKQMNIISNNKMKEMIENELQTEVEIKNEEKL
jgi:guanylate kinase